MENTSKFYPAGHMQNREYEFKGKGSEKQEIILFFIKNGILISPDFFEYVLGLIKQGSTTNDLQDIGVLLSFLFGFVSDFSRTIAYLNKDAFLLFKNTKNRDSNKDINWKEFEKYRAKLERNESDTYNRLLSNLVEDTETEKNEKNPGTKESRNLDMPGQNNARNLGKVNVVFSYKDEIKKRDIQDFVAYYNRRYEALSSMIKSREEMSNLTSISRLMKKTDKTAVSVIGLVKDKTTTSNKNIMLTLEDPTGEIKVLISKNKPELVEEAKDIVFDEVIGVSGVSGKGILFCNSIVWPDVPIKELKKSATEEYALFLSDIHVGSNNFLEDKFNRFIDWINGRLGDERQKEIASKVHYIFIIGDIVDGVGIYPKQEEELVINDIYKQFEKAAELL